MDSGISLLRLNSEKENPKKIAELKRNAIPNNQYNAEIKFSVEELNGRELPIADLKSLPTQNVLAAITEPRWYGELSRLREPLNQLYYSS